ncbi:MAG TPA: DNA methyltransferase, partial [Candidatus Binatia bacterium]|nr:DNA methyltransferase [Candidatus Binatia bacterium]
MRADAREIPLADNSAQCCITSPPYWGLRDYGTAGQIGLGKTPEEYVAKMVEVFREVRRVLRDDGTLWLNLGSSYAGSWGNYQPTGTGGQRFKQTERFDRKAYGDVTWRPPTSFVSGGRNPSRSLSSSHAPACGNDGKEFQNSSHPDFSYSDLCDECSRALKSRSENKLSLEPSSFSDGSINHDNAHSDCAGEAGAAVLLGAQASTKIESLPQPQGECSHCANCGACLSVLRSSLRDASLCARNLDCKNDIVSPAGTLA